MLFAALRDVCRVYSIGDDATEIFFVEEGAMEVIWEDVRIPKNKRIQHKVAKVDETQSLGEEGLLTDDNETPWSEHVFTAIATRMTTLFYIDRAATQRLLYYHPKVKARCQVLIAQKLNRWQVQLQLVLKEYLEQLSASSGSGEFGKSLHEYEPKGLLSVPVFSQCGQLVDPKTETDAETASDQDERPVQSVTETEEGTVAALRADMQRLEAKLDRALDALMQP